MMRCVILLFLVTLSSSAVWPAWPQAPSAPAVSNDVGVGHAVLGGLADGYGGLVLGTVATRLACGRGAHCSMVPAALSGAAGTVVGAYAGATDRDRAYAALIGVGVGVFGGALAYGIWSGVRRISDGTKPDPFLGFGLAIVGGALGALVGTAVGGTSDESSAIAAPAGRTAVAAPIAVRVSF